MSATDPIKNQSYLRCFANPDVKRCCIISLALISTVAISVFIALATQGTLPPSIGYGVIGAAGAYMLLKFPRSDLKNRKWEIILTSLVAATFIVLGALTVTGAISLPVAGWSVGLFLTCHVGFLLAPYCPDPNDPKKKVAETKKI